jgi:hypothetical protein
MVRQQAQRVGAVEADLHEYFLRVATEAERSFKYKDPATGREFPLLRHGFYDSSIAADGPEKALLVVYAGAGSRLSINGVRPQAAVAVWDDLPAGTHRLTVEQAGREPVVRMVNVTASQLRFLPSLNFDDDSRTSDTPTR